MCVCVCVCVWCVWCVCSCYGAENAETLCCNTCEEVREAYRKRGWAISNPKVSYIAGERGRVS